jgi:hypothetical protein
MCGLLPRQTAGLNQLLSNRHRLLRQSLANAHLPPEWSLGGWNLMAKWEISECAVLLVLVKSTVVCMARWLFLYLSAVFSSESYLPFSTLE